MNTLYLPVLVLCFIACTASKKIDADVSTILEELDETEKLLRDASSENCFYWNAKFWKGSKLSNPKHTKCGLEVCVLCRDAFVQCDPEVAKTCPGVDEPGKEPSYPEETSYPVILNWAERGYLHEAQAQMSCGACWAFPFTAVLQATYKMYTGEMPLLSVQHLVDCNWNYSGCAGGIASDAYHKHKLTQFLPYDESNPYVGYYHDKADRNCQHKTKNAISKMWLTNLVTPASIESEMIKALQRGPVAAGLNINLGNWDNGENIIGNEGCGTDRHAVTVVGYTPEYWILQDSHGTNSGSTETNCYDGMDQRGFKRLSRKDTGQCDLFKHMEQFEMTYRRELEYAVGTTKLRAIKANKACKEKNKNGDGETGWTLAVIPTAMHQEEVLDLIKKHGRDDETFWIGLRRSPSLYWLDRFTPVQFYNSNNGDEGKHVFMSKATGKSWKFAGPNTKRMYVCSRAVKCWNFDTAIRHATVTFSGERKEGTTATVKCDDGYTLIGKAKLTCEAGKWRGAYPKCKK